jgi:alpha-tubulin suppressor-like RCC1 family protein
VSSVSCGHRHSISLLSDGSITTWGLNVNGQLGTGNYINAYSPILVNLNSKLLLTSQASFVLAGSDYSAVFMKDGVIYGFGSNSNGKRLFFKLFHRTTWCW